MELTIRPMTLQERMYSYSQSSQIESQTGCIGHLRGDLDGDGEAFLSSWTGHRDDLKTQDFKDERCCVMPGIFRRQQTERIQCIKVDHTEAALVVRLGCSACYLKIKV